MYPPVTQFETRDNLFREELRLRHARQALRPRRRRRGITRWLAHTLRPAPTTPRRAGGPGSC